MSQRNSCYALELKIPISASLSLTEAVLERELPKIKEKSDKLASVPAYLGVNSLADGIMSLLILVECREQDFFDVQRFLNREIRLIMEREKIPMA